MQRQNRNLAAVCTAIAAAISIAACGSSAPPGSGGSTGGPGQPSSSGPASSTALPAQPIACAGGWRTGPLTVTKQVSVPPVPIATAVRTGSHPDCKFDRLVIDIGSAIPGYSVRLVSKVIEDASGRTVTMPGTRYLVIRLEPAQGHSAGGQATLPAGIQTVNDPMLRAWTISGDSEGVLSIALGLAHGSSYRIGELGGRIYADVAW